MVRLHRALSASPAFVACILLLGLASCRGDDSSSGARSPTSPTSASMPTTTVPLPAGYAGYRSAIYADRANWLCRGDVEDDVCDVDMDATVVEPDGSTTIERFTPVEDAAVDCFYVYPTISTDPGANSDLVPGENQELFVVRQQAARLGSECRVFAPVYRQNTLTALTARLTGRTVPPADPNVSAFGDVVDAWKHYIANDNGGRGVVLIGHSQGAGLLVRLIAQEIDPDPNLRARLVSAFILGAPVRTPPDADVGGVFANIPVCRASDQTGCVVSYASFRSTAPPPPDSYFGRVANGKAACANPAAPAGGAASLHPYFGTAGRALPDGTGGAATPPQWVQGETITTPFVTLPGLVEGECVEANGFSYLALTVHADPNSPRLNQIGGDLTPQWGMHLIDVNVAMGDIVALVHGQIRMYTRT